MKVFHLLCCCLRSSIFPVAIIIFFATSQSASGKVAPGNATIMFSCEERTPGFPDKEGQLHLILNGAGEGRLIEGSQEGMDLSPRDLSVAGGVVQVKTGDGLHFEIDMSSGRGKLFLADVHTYDLHCKKQKRSRIYDRLWSRLEKQTRDASQADIDRAIEVFDEIVSNRNICQIYREFTSILMGMAFDIDSAFDDALADDGEEYLYGLGKDFEKAYTLKIDKSTPAGRRYTDAVRRLEDACHAMSASAYSR